MRATPLDGTRPNTEYARQKPPRFRVAEMRMTEVTPRVTTLERGLRLIEFIVETKAVTVTSVAKYLNIQKSASHRFLNTLRSLGYVEQTDHGDYILSDRLHLLAQGIVPKIEVRNVAEPYLLRLARISSLPSHLGFWDGREITYLDQKIANSVVTGYIAGNRIPAYCSAMGKAVLAFLPENEQKKYLKTVPLAPVTPRTIVDPKELKRDLDEARKNGYAVMDDEMVVHMKGIAAPIMLKNGYPRYAVSIGGMYFGDLEEYVEKFREPVMNAAREISDFLICCRSMEEN